MPDGPIFHLQRRDEGDYDLGAFRAWAGYKTFGTEAATGGQVLRQHVVSFGASDISGRTGVHCHLAPPACPLGPGGAQSASNREAIP